MGQAIDAEHLSELTEEELETGFRAASVARLRGFARIDVKYLMPIFTRRFTPQVEFLIGRKLHILRALELQLSYNVIYNNNEKYNIFNFSLIFDFRFKNDIYIYKYNNISIIGSCTLQDVYDGTKQMSALTDQWYRTVRPSDTESTTDERSTTESV